MKYLSTRKKLLNLFIIVVVLAAGKIDAQFKANWMSVGSLHNWYSEIGCEYEEGLVRSQQYGLRWPAIYQYQDMQAAKALWIGCTNFNDPILGKVVPHKVVHIGPRVTGADEFFPVEFKLINKFNPPEVVVDGVTSFQLDTETDEEPDPTLPYDRLIYNLVNTQIGLTMERKIYEFSQQYHDNYIIHEVTFTNTGNTDADPEIELPNNTLENVIIYYQYRWAVCRQTRYVIGNGTGWGMNTMLSTRGDGVMADPPDEQFRAQFAWHGKFPPFSAYDNIGGPIWQPGGVGFTTAGDTLGRLGAAQFCGVVTLHADTSPSDQADDASQPSTTSWEGSDENFTSGNSAFNTVKMTGEYTEWMAKGHKAPRHAWAVEPAGKFTEPSGDPALSTPGGFSAANGYGPYTIAPGESIKIVWAEAASGLDYAHTVLYGKQYKNGVIDAKTKNEFVMTSRDSLFQTFRRAIANYNDGNGFVIPQAPLPPKNFNVNSGGDRISLSWELYDEADPNELTGFEIYRATGQFDSTYHLVKVVDANVRNYDDTDLIRGVNYYYYIQAVGNASNNNGAGLTPSGPLRSGRYYTQTYDPANLKRQAGTSLSQIRIVPNPFIISSDENRMRFPGEGDKLAFFNIPGQCTIQIFTELGELIKEIEHTDGSGDEFWNSVTSSNQVIVSGIYIAVVTNSNTGEKAILKFAIVR